MSNKNRNIIIKFESYNKQTVGQITKINGLMKAKYLISVINNLNLDANPRSSRTGSVTNAIQDSIENDPKLFPMKTKGILLASSNYENLERNRIKLIPQDLRIEGILDGGHNTLAIGLYILKKAMSFKDKSLSNKSKTFEFTLLINIFSSFSIILTTIIILSLFKTLSYPNIQLLNSKKFISPFIRISSLNLMDDILL